MNTLGDADTLAFMLGVLAVAGLLSFVLTWNAPDPQHLRTSKYFLIASLTILSTGVIILVAAMYFKTRHDLYALAPTHDDKLWAVILIVVHALCVIGYAVVYRHVRRQPVYR